jgi:GntR family transcriptional repressor for pyruvate dehydrogenase complex
MMVKKEDVLVSSLIQFLMDSDMKEGDRLPPERELSEKFNASRNTLRSAVKSLQAKGILEVKPRSGYFLRSIINLKHYLNTQDSENRLDMISEQIEAFFILEPVIVEFCAKKITQKEFDQLDRNLVGLSKAIIECDAKRIAQNHKVIYQTISLATKNRMMLIALEKFEQMFESQSTVLSYISQIERSAVFAAHVKLVNGIKNHDLSVSVTNTKDLIMKLAKLLHKYESVPIPQEIAEYISNKNS